jgi:hypothetical protein
MSISIYYVDRQISLLIHPTQQPLSGIPKETFMITQIRSNVRCPQSILPVLGSSIIHGLRIGRFDIGKLQQLNIDTIILLFLIRSCPSGYSPNDMTALLIENTCPWLGNLNHH